MCPVTILTSVVFFQKLVHDIEDIKKKRKMPTKIMEYRRNCCMFCDTGITIKTIELVL